MKQFVTSCTGASQTLTPTIDEKVKIYDSYANAVSCIACLAEGEIVATKSGNSLDMSAVECMIDEKVSCAESYSTTATPTGGTWINGCPIYRKVIDIGTLPNAGVKNVSTGETNINVFHIYGSLNSPTSHRTWPYLICNVAYNTDIDAICNGSCLSIQTWSNMSNYNCNCVVIEFYRR